MLELFQLYQVITQLQKCESHVATRFVETITEHPAEAASFARESSEDDLQNHLISIFVICGRVLIADDSL